jgi:hypothetical protein
MAVQQVLLAHGSAGGGGGPGAHRYWRLFVTQSDGSAFIGTTELQLFDSAGTNRSGGASLLSIASSTDLNSGNARDLAFDNNIVNSGWLSDGSAAPQWVRIDVESAAAPPPRTAYEVKRFRIYGSWNVPTASPRAFQLQWSDNDSTWTTALSVTGQTGWTANEMREFIVF